MRYRYILYILALVPVFIFRDFMPGDEMKYLSVADEALRNGDWLTFGNHGAVYAEKPPFYFWLLMLSRLAAGQYCMWLMGLFSLLPAAGVMMVMDRWMKQESVRNNPLISNMLIGTTALFTGTALSLRMDMLMTLFVVLSLYAFFRMYKGGGKPRQQWLFPLWLFLAFFTGGPLGLLMPLVPVVMFLQVKKEVRSIWRYLGWRQLAVFGGLLGVWLGAVYLKGGTGELSAIVSQNFGSLDAPRYKAHLFYYFPRMFATFAPWALMYLAVIWMGVRRRLFQTDTERFFYTIVWTNILLLTFLGAKSNIFMLPICPFVAYLSSAMLSRTGGGRAVNVCVIIPAIALALLWPASFIFNSLTPVGYSDPTILRVAYFVGSLGGLITVWSLYRNKISQGIWYIATFVVTGIFIASFSLPLYNKGADFRTMAGEAGVTAVADSIARFYYYGDPGLADMDFLLGRQLEEIVSAAQLDTLDTSRHRSILFIPKGNPEAEEWINARQREVHTGPGTYWIVTGMRPETEDRITETEE